MANSDVSNWYDWKQNDYTEQLHRSKSESTRNYGLESNCHEPSTYNEAKTESPRLNGWIRSNRRSINTQSTSDVRFVNPAIYVESFKGGAKNLESPRIHGNLESLESARKSRIQADCGDSGRVNTLLSQLSVKDVPPISTVSCSGDQNSAQATYRCHSVNSLTTGSSAESSVVSSLVTSRRAPYTERRCKIDDNLMTESRDGPFSARQSEPVIQRFTVNGHRVVQMRTTATSCTSIVKQSERGPNLGRKVAHEEWVRKKEQAAQHKKKTDELTGKTKLAEAEKLAREKEEREWRERENFLRWNERKKKEDEERRAAIEKEIALQKRLKDVQDKAEGAKSLCLQQWCLRKKEEQKARQKKIELEQKQIDDDRKKRFEESSKAYEKWREISKNKPRPATQGLLPHQKAKPAFVNPVPWQNIVDDPDTGDNQEEEPWNRKSKSSRSKTFNSRYTRPWE